MYTNGTCRPTQVHGMLITYACACCYFFIIFFLYIKNIESGIHSLSMSNTATSPLPRPSTLSFHFPTCSERVANSPHLLTSSDSGREGLLKMQIFDGSDAPDLTCRQSRWSHNKQTKKQSRLGLLHFFKSLPGSFQVFLPFSGRLPCNLMGHLVGGKD